MPGSVCHAVGALLLLGRHLPLRRRRLLSWLVLSVEGFAGATHTAVEELSQLWLLPFADSTNPENIPVEGGLAPLSIPSCSPAIPEVVVEARVQAKLARCPRPPGRLSPWTARGQPPGSYHLGRELGQREDDLRPR